jgi:hypothetical protein
MRERRWRDAGVGIQTCSRSEIFGRIVDGMKEETARRCGGSGFGAATSCEDARNFFESELTATDIDHGANEIAHHVMKEAVAADAVEEKLAGVSRALLPG